MPNGIFSYYNLREVFLLTSSGQRDAVNILQRIATENPQ